jgi:tetratricopeptide (TPR) repeat protein
MTVRWKPLLVLSGLFVVVALGGVVALMLTLAPRSSQGILKMARAARQAGRFEDSEIHYKQALQLEPKSAAIHEEFASLYHDWQKQAPPAKKAALRNDWLEHMVSAVKFDAAAASPRRQLLVEAMTQQIAADSVYWANELLKLEADDPDAHYILAVESLDTRTPNIPEIQVHLKTLEEKNAPPVRRLLITAELADANGDQAARDASVEAGINAPLATEADLIDRTAIIRLAAIAVRTQTEPARLEKAVKIMLENVKGLGKPETLSATRLARLRVLLERTQRSLTSLAAKSGASAKPLEELASAIELDLDSIFKQALAGASEPDIQTYLTYADHLRIRQEHERSLQVIDDALKSPQASRRAAINTVMGLHTVAVEAALARLADQSRFERAAPHIQALIDSRDARFEGLGHLFAGSVDLDRSGMARDMAKIDSTDTTTRPDPRLKASALTHLRQAAAQLPEMAEAQARYGVALVLSGEQSLGRQFLQTSLRLGGLEPQYQLWAAWTILQAGYPEEAEPIVESLLAQVASGAAARELEGALHLLSGELHQAKRTPEDLRKAVTEFDRALSTDQRPTVSVVMRLAQIDAQLGHYDSALKRLEAVAAEGKGGASVLQLMVLTLEESGKKADARARLVAARKQFPTSEELAAVDASLKAKDGDPKAADKVLADYLTRNPDHPNLAMMRAQILTESLKKPDQAREVLTSIADRTDNSAPLVQLAALEMEQNRLDAASAVIAKVRTRWKEAATSDVLEAQLALKRGQTALAIEHFDDALKKDPDNKIVRFWKAQLDGRSGAVAEAAKSLEAIIRNKPMKEVEQGTPLLAAAQSALANLSMRSGVYDDAIRRFEELKKGGASGTLSRYDRWQLIGAYVAKGNWPVAKREIAAILNDEKNPPTDEERVRGANFYRQKGENAAALAQLDFVLKVSPANPSAVVTRSFILLKEKNYDQSAKVLRKAIEISKKAEKSPPVFYLMLAAVENETPPRESALERALKALDDGLSRSPDSSELVQTRYVAMSAGGDKKGAISFVETKAKEFPKGPFRRMLVDVYRDQKDYDRCEAVLNDLRKESPDDPSLAVALVQIVSAQAAEASVLNLPDREKELNNKASTLIRQFETRFPKNLAFLQAECELTARIGDFTRAMDLTREIDKLSPESTMGPMLRTRIFTALNKTREVAQAYSEVLERDPRQLEVRMLLGQAKLKLGEPDEALRQAKFVIDAEGDEPQAILLEARALAMSGNTGTQKKAQYREAVARLEGALASNPKFEEGYHTLAEIHLLHSERAAAIATWKKNLEAIPGDGAAASRLVEVLCMRQSSTKGPSADDVALAQKIAKEIADRDKTGTLRLALSIGFQKAGQFETALRLGEDAAEKLESPVARLNYGDLLLTTAESQSDPAKAKASFEKAVEQYDKVLSKQPSSIQAINNKSWILHNYLGKSQAALDLVLDLKRRVSTTYLPGEVHDTLGVIQEAMGQYGDAEQSYLDGLKKVPENPVLNFHIGKLIAGNPDRSLQAKEYLEKAMANRDRLSSSMAAEAVRLIRLLDKAGAAN